MIILLAMLGFVVVMRQICLHIIRYQKLKSENAFLRQHWKETMSGKP